MFSSVTTTFNYDVNIVYNPGDTANYFADFSSSIYIPLSFNINASKIASDNINITVFFFIYLTSASFRYQSLSPTPGN